MPRRAPLDGSPSSLCERGGPEEQKAARRWRVNNQARLPATGLIPSARACFGGCGVLAETERDSTLPAPRVCVTVRVPIWWLTAGRQSSLGPRWRRQVGAAGHSGRTVRNQLRRRRSDVSLRGASPRRDLRRRGRVLLRPHPSPRESHPLAPARQPCPEMPLAGWIRCAAQGRGTRARQIMAAAAREHQPRRAPGVDAHRPRPRAPLGEPAAPGVRQGFELLAVAFICGGECMDRPLNLGHAPVLRVRVPRRAAVRSPRAPPGLPRGHHPPLPAASPRRVARATPP